MTRLPLNTAVIAAFIVLAACSGKEEARDPTPAERPAYEPLKDLPAGTRAVLRVDPARLESFQATIMERFDGNAPLPADLDVALATTSAAIIYPPQPTRLFSAPLGRNPLPSLDRTRPIYHALTTEPALAFVDALRVGKTPTGAPSLGARLYLPATNAESLAREFGSFCDDGRNESMTNGCTTVASHTAKNGWIVVELDYGGATARVRTNGSTSWARRTPAVESFLDDESALALWFDTSGLAEVGAVMTWHEHSYKEAVTGGSKDSPFEATLDAMAPILRSDPGAREAEDITFSLRSEGRDIAVDGVRTLTQRGLARAEASDAGVVPKSFDVKEPLLHARLPWSTAAIRGVTEPPQWAVDEATIGRIGWGHWRQTVPWLEAPFAYYIGLAYGPRPVRAAGWLRVFFSLDGARLLLDGSLDETSPLGIGVRGGVAAVPADGSSLSAVSSVMQGYGAQAAVALGSVSNFEVLKDGDRSHVVTSIGSVRSTTPSAKDEVVLYADLERVAALIEGSGNDELFGPQAAVFLRAAGAVELTLDRNGAGEAWRLHIGTDDVASAAAPDSVVSPLLLEPLDVCVVEARKAAAEYLRATIRGKEAAPARYDDIAARCTTEEGRRLLAN